MSCNDQLKRNSLDDGSFQFLIVEMCYLHSTLLFRNIAQCLLTILQLIVNCLQDQLITADTVLGILDSGPGDLANLHRQKFLLTNRQIEEGYDRGSMSLLEWIRLWIQS
jgi:hypothetical protein